MRLKPKHSVLLVGLAYLSFVSLGLPDGMNGVAWPSIRAGFNLPLDALGALLVMFTAGYLVSSFSSGRLLALVSVGTLLALSCLATAVSLIGYALAPAWWVMVALGSLAGLGAGAIDAGLNTFAATEFNARMVNWLHACYGIGAATGPAIMTAVLAAHHPWQSGYLIVGGWQLVLAGAFGLTLRSWPKASATGQSHSEAIARASNLSTLKLPVVRLSIAVFFVYTGIEAAAGTWAYSLFTESRAVPMMTAGMWISVYWGALTAGRLLSGLVVGFVPVHHLLRVCFVSIALGATLIWLGGAGLLSFAGLALMGLASAPVFPSMISATPMRLGEAHTANGVGFQIAAAVLGQSLLPSLVGLLAGKLGLEVIAPALLGSACLLLVLFEALTAASPAAGREAPSMT
ncbi:MAG: MFS transporter [Acidobacteriota bacterium]